MCTLHLHGSCCKTCVCMPAHVYIAGGSFEVKLRSENMDRCSKSSESSQRRERVRREKNRKVAPAFWADARSKIAPRFEVKILKTPRSRSTFGISAVQKVHAVVARSTFRSQHVQNTRWAVQKVHAAAARSTFWSENGKNATVLEHFWTLSCSKLCTSLRRKAHFEDLRSKHDKDTTFGPLLGVQRSFFVAGTGFCILPKVSKTCGFRSSCKNDGRRGTFEEDPDNATLQLQLQLRLQLHHNYTHSYNYNYTTLYQTTTTLHLRLQPHYNCNCNCNCKQIQLQRTTTTPLQLQLQLQLRYNSTTLQLYNSTTTTITTTILHYKYTTTTLGYTSTLLH